MKITRMAYADTAHTCFPLILLFAIVATFLSACGGGGGGGGNAGTPIQYSGSTVAAPLSATTAGPLAAVIFGNNASVGMIVGLENVDRNATRNQPVGVLTTLDGLGAALRKVALGGFGRPSASGPMSALAVNTTDPCDFGGDLRITGNVNDSSGLGTLNATFSNCNMGPATINGSMAVRIDAFDVFNGIPTDMTFSFQSLSMSGPGISSASAGSMRMQINSFGSVDLMTNIVTRDNLRSTMTKLENFSIFSSPIGDPLNPTHVTQLLDGRIYHSAYGYIDVTTFISMSTPVGPSIEVLYPVSGYLTLTGNGNATLKVSAMSGTRVRLELDADGNASIDRDVVIAWTDLGGPIGSDIGDTDGDGMPNGWEVHYGLDKLSAADAALDLDGDTAPNLSEYQNGTSPANPVSHPTLADLGISISHGPTIVATPGQLTYTMTGTNFSTGSATAFRITNTLPAGVSVASIFPSVGSFCDNFSNGPNPVVSCEFGTVPGGASVTLTIVVNVSAPGSLSSQATVESNEVDPNPADNTAIDNATAI